MLKKIKERLCHKKAIEKNKNVSAIDPKIDEDKGAINQIFF